ncbi:hypothetical protein [Serratia rubidaea]|uniref:Uncharacterized protein n=1 Tax=Serratia rubidaea TaxID=61652 RepID=A0ABS0MDN9_SERRU|nr:hypothetical protein [Serratia rubidaea]MBH1930480.1 hypothetical protein [Serratia rubidaea]MCR1000588.1 hypothetical protein [Serratia rubidaea]MDC6109391.1 hypothetical protein [Serratia rubidaea]MDC6117580.1 hypothetical protein [Serratia rubidaea]MEB7586040.1 hypothetical protein [Serratia rubidaea]
MTLAHARAHQTENDYNQDTAAYLAMMAFQNAFSMIRIVLKTAENVTDYINVIRRTFNNHRDQ